MSHDEGEPAIHNENHQEEHSSAQSSRIGKAKQHANKLFRNEKFQLLFEAVQAVLPS